VAIAVAAVVIVGVLATAAYFAPHHTPSSAESYTTLTEAEALAGHSVTQALSGSWSAAFALGLRLSSNISVPTSLLPSSFSTAVGPCNLTARFTPVGSLPVEVTIQETPVSASPGTTSFWLLGLTNGAGGLTLATVSLGVGTALYSVSVSTCLGASVQLAPFPATTPDSPQLVAGANASGGASFLETYPFSAQIWGGVGGFSAGGVTLSLPFNWEVVDTSCPLPYPVNETGAEFNATLSPTGSVLAATHGPVSCDFGLGSTLPTLFSGSPGSMSAVSKAI
jgi:hypothetical protein